MVRIKRGITSHLRHKKILKQTKGYFGRTATIISMARQRFEKAKQYIYKHRRLLKRNLRRNWIEELTILSKENNTSYSKLKYFTSSQNTLLNTKLYYILTIREFLSIRQFLKLMYLKKWFISV